MDKEQKIVPVSNNQEKYQTYKALIERYRTAMAEEFYLEALVIDYALIEDRLLSWMYYLGIASERNSQEITEIAKNNLRDILAKHSGKEKKYSSSLSIHNLSDKLKILCCILDWSAKALSSDIADNKYLLAIQKQCESLNYEVLKNTLRTIYDWKCYRNSIVHELMNTNIVSLESGIAEQVIVGKRSSEILDNQLKVFKKGNVVRKAAGLGNE